MHQQLHLDQDQGDWTVDELICTCISRQIEDGEMVAQGMATPLVAAGYMLAKLTHAPNITFASVIGNSLCLKGGPLAMSRVENVWIGNARRFASFTDVVCSVLPAMHLKEFFRRRGTAETPATWCSGTHRPRLRWARRHSDRRPSPIACTLRAEHGKATFVPKLDFAAELAR